LITASRLESAGGWQTGEELGIAVDIRRFADASLLPLVQ
jgi:hypothetical protein